MGDFLKTVNEVMDYQIYVGTAGPFNFNGLVRHYYLRRGPMWPTSRSTWPAKGHRQQQSHDIAKRVRPALKAIADRYGARVKVAEVPPGPPVLSTLVAEIYGPDYERQRELALKVREIFEATAGVVDVDWYMEENQPRVPPRSGPGKAALHGISVAQITGILKRPWPEPRSDCCTSPWKKKMSRWCCGLRWLHGRESSVSMRSNCRPPTAVWYRFPSWSGPKRPILIAAFTIKT